MSFQKYECLLNVLIRVFLVKVGGQGYFSPLSIQPQIALFNAKYELYVLREVSRESSVGILTIPNGGVEIFACSKAVV